MANILDEYSFAIKEKLQVPYVAALSLLALVLLTVGRYGIFGDELYYIACGQRLAFGGHNNYWIWGPGRFSGALFIAVGMPRNQLEEIYEDVQTVFVDL